MAYARAVDRYVAALYICLSNGYPEWVNRLSPNMPRELYTPLVAILGVPFLVLLFDYIFRWPPILDTLRRAGPDFCILGLGSCGAVFIDKKVIESLTRRMPLPVELDMIIIVLVILAFRQIAFRLTEQKSENQESATLSAVRAISSCAFGLASVILISVILYVGYTS